MVTRYGRQGMDTPLQSNRFFDVTESVFLKRPDESPFTALMIALERAVSVTGDPKFLWFNKGIRSQSTTATAASLIASTTLVVVDASIYVPSDIIVVVDVTTGAFGATHRVTVVNTSTNTLTVVRAINGSLADGNIAIGDTILRVGNAQEEGSALPEAIAQKLEELYNYTQIFRHSSKYTRTFFESNKWHADIIGKELQTNRTEKRKEHKREIESAFLFGTRGIEGQGTDVARRRTAGLNDWLAKSAAAGVDNREDVAGAGVLTLPILQAFLADKGFAYGGQEKWALATSSTIAVLNELVDDRIRLPNNPTNFGLNVTTFNFTMGTVHLVRHDLLKYGIYKNAMLMFDPDHLEINFMGDSMTRFKTNVGLASDDDFKDSWLTEAGLKVAVPETLSRLGNIISSS